MFSNLDIGPKPKQKKLKLKLSFGKSRMSLIDFFIFFIWACREFNFRKWSGKKVSEVSRFSGYSGFVGSPVCREPCFSEKNRTFVRYIILDTLHNSTQYIKMVSVGLTVKKL